MFNEGDGDEDDADAHRPSSSCAPVRRAVEPLSAEGLRVHNVELEALCKRPTARTGVPWPQADPEGEHVVDIFDGLRPTVGAVPKRLTPLWPSTIKAHSHCLRESCEKWRRPFSFPMKDMRDCQLERYVNVVADLID